MEPRPGSRKWEFQKVCLSHGLIGAIVRISVKDSFIGKGLDGSSGAASHYHR